MKHAPAQPCHPPVSGDTEATESEPVQERIDLKTSSFPQHTPHTEILAKASSSVSPPPNQEIQAEKEVPMADTPGLNQPLQLAMVHFWPSEMANDEQQQKKSIEDAQINPGGPPQLPNQEREQTDSMVNQPWSKPYLHC